MSIHDTIIQNVKSLNDYAKLPQNILMSMVQKGQIPQDMLAPILARKSEMADAAAAMRAAAESRNAPQGSIIEQLMTKNAEAERPRTPRDMGVAALPVRDGMYDEQSFAAGGIVAFQNNPNQPVNEYMPRVGESENEYLQRVKAISEIGSEFFTPRNYNPLAKAGDLYNLYQEKIGQPFAAGVRKFVSEPLGEQADRFRRASAARENIGKKAAGIPTTSEEVKRMAPADKIVGNEQALFDAERLAKESKMKSAPTLDSTGNIVAAKGAPKTKQEAASQANLVAQETGTSPTSAYEKILLEQGEDAKKARQEAKYMRLLEAGLGIMGGTSPYALTNIGAGAIGAAKGYAEDVKGMRAEERERAKLLATMGMEREKIGMEREKLGIMKGHYDNLYRLGLQENEIRRIIANRTPDQIRLIERYMSDPAFADAFSKMSIDKRSNALDQLVANMGKGGKPIDKDAVLTEVQNFLAKK